MSKMRAHISGIDKLSVNAYSTLSELATIEYKILSSEEGLKVSLSNCDIFWFRLNHNLTREILKEASCKYVVCAVTGLDHIDLKACEEFGISVISLKGEVEFLKEVRATAEHTMGLLLALIRKTKIAFKHSEAGKWNRNEFQGRELYKKKIGILGLGRLGKIVAKYAAAFGMDVYYFDKENVATSKHYKKCNSMDELFTIVDVLSIHVSYNEVTHFIINRNLLSKMKSTAIIINTARGGIIDEIELLNFLKNNKIAGYATDVLCGEPNIESHPLVKYAAKNEHVIITPHIGGYTIESVEKTENFLAKKLYNIININK